MKILRPPVVTFCVSTVLEKLIELLPAVMKLLRRRLYPAGHLRILLTFGLPTCLLRRRMYQLDLLCPDL
jgi:hypothetical protein